jgi:hypothetical protein
MCASTWERRSGRAIEARGRLDRAAEPEALGVLADALIAREQAEVRRDRAGDERAREVERVGRSDRLFLPM